MRQQREIGFGGEREQPPGRNCRSVPLMTKLSAIADRDRRGGGKRRDRQVAASMLDTAITSSIRNIISVSETTSSSGVDQDRHPAQAIEQVEQRRSACAICACAASEAGSARKRRQLRIMAAWMHSMPAVQAAAGTGCIQKPNSTPVATTSSIDDIGGRQPRLGVLAQQFGVEGRARSAGRR